ncbi:DUF5789 family protein [Halococcus salsus]|uniref:DUF5789 family protein n=1 Tax=Halococcus salsus TaxID=2162894 RepID=UPI00135C979B|nr:DUF5789 family protein [Halococcus salsus]
MSDTDETRQQGIEFGEFEETMESLDYPVEHSDLVADHGDAELELPNGDATLEEVLEPLQDEEQTYQDKEELETMIMNMVGDDAIGRENYSDRDSAGIGEEPDEGEDGDDEEQSL